MPQFVRDIRILGGVSPLLEDPGRLEEVRCAILAGDCFIARSVYPAALLRQIRDYLVNIGRNSLPNYHAIEPGCPNFHRLNNWDERSYVKGCFHQFCFFPWNQDLFNLFEVFRPIYELKNRLSGLPAGSFLERLPEHGCIARLAFQFYPAGRGGLHCHADPVDQHQLTVPTMLLCRKGEDFQEGGAYVEKEDGKLICLDDLMDWGDVAYFNARVRHGVLSIDPGKESPWLSFQGRWMLLFAVNKLQSNATIADSVDLEPTHAR
jgi:hypothetical protein